MSSLAAAVASGLQAITVEPIMLIDGACNHAMLILMENVQMVKICRSHFGFSEEVCDNLPDHEEQNVLVQKELSLFTFYNSIILSVVSLLFILFMGAWSDVYGRKFPLLLTFVCQVINVVGYLLVHIIPGLPIEFIYLVSFVMSFGGGNTGLMSIAFSYSSDISTEENRTNKISTINSVWYLGGPIGTGVIGVVLRHSSYEVALSLMLGLYVFATLYIIFVIKESNGPFAVIGNSVDRTKFDILSKEDVKISKMVMDFVNWRRVLESFQSLFKRRAGYDRALILISVLCNMARRGARGFFIYMFTRTVLSWDATDYSYWTTYRILVTALASLFLVPLLTKMLNASDNVLVIIGSVSSAMEYLAFALVLSPAWSAAMWVAPVLGMLTNAQIAMRSLPTKIVGPDENGRITAATGALTSLMPMVGYAFYTAIYVETVTYFPGAQFLFGGAINIGICIAFLAMYVAIKCRKESVDLEKQAMKTSIKSQIRSTGPLKRLFSSPLSASSNTTTDITRVVAELCRRNSSSLCRSCSGGAPVVVTPPVESEPSLSLSEVSLADCTCSSVKGTGNMLVTGYYSPLTDDQITKSET